MSKKLLLAITLLVMTGIAAYLSIKDINDFHNCEEIQPKDIPTTLDLKPGYTLKVDEENNKSYICPV